MSTKTLGASKSLSSEAAGHAPTADGIEPTPPATEHSGQPSQLGIAELIRQAQEHPPKPIIEGLLNEHEIVGLHGLPEAFKTTFCLQLAESLATGEALLQMWPVPNPVTVYFLETEMSTSALGNRLKGMFQGRSVPERVTFASEQQLRQFKREGSIAQKFALLKKWVSDAAAEVLIIDTCNPFFRGRESANDETTAGAFFDQLEAVGAPTKMFVRHNRKPRMEDVGAGASQIRGSGQFADVPDLLLELRRIDRRNNEAKLDITKFRHGTKPEELTVWFDTATLRLIALPPVVHLLRDGPLSRTELLNRLQARFGVAQRNGDDRISEVRGALRETQRGHEKVYELNWEAAQSEEWYARCPRP
jgi:hypothetical protein